MFHERLASVTPETIAEFGVRSWNSRHDETAAYFNEYLPLLVPGETGLPRFRPDFSYERLVPSDGPRGDISHSEAEYLEGLIAFAVGRNERPVLTCGRTLFRGNGIRKRHGGLHILLVRDLEPQWRSYLRQTNEGTYYFLNVTLEMLANSGHDAFLAEIERRNVQYRACANGRYLSRFESIDTFLRAFLAIHVYSYLAAYENADLTVNASSLARGQQAVRDAETAMSDLTKLNIKLADARESVEPTPRGTGDVTPAETSQMLKEASLHLGSGPAAVEFVEALLDDFHIAHRS